MMKRKSRWESVGPSSEIPTSSMADIAFLLIIFFMVTAVFSATKGLELHLSDKESSDGEPEPSVLVHLQVAGLEVDCRAMPLEALLPYLEPRLTRNPNKPVILYPDGDVSYERVVEVYDHLAGAGSEESPWGFQVRNIALPTGSEIAAYVEIFGLNPMEAACN
jgi:biopolymer transport protein ExbD